MIFIEKYHLDFQLKFIKYLRLEFSTSENFSQNELDIISQFLVLKESNYEGCRFSLIPRKIKITYLNNQWIEFTQPYRPGSVEYQNLIESVSSTSQFQEYKTTPEQVYWDYIRLRTK